MKKIFAIVTVAVMMLTMCSVTAFAELSPTVKPTPQKPSGSDTSPQTGNTAVYAGMATLMMAAAASVLAVKKIKE